MNICVHCNNKAVYISPENLCRKHYDILRRQTDSYKEYQKQYRKTDKRKQYLYNYERKPERIAGRKERELKYRNKLTLEAFEKMLEEQNFSCAACGSKQNKKRLSVDHNHITGKIRGLLCNPCNLALGNARESIQVLKGLIEYIQKFE